MKELKTTFSYQNIFWKSPNRAKRRNGQGWEWDDVVLTSALGRRTAREDVAHLSIPSHRLLQSSTVLSQHEHGTYAGQDLLNTRHRLPAGPLGGRPRAQIDEGVRARETQGRGPSRADSKRITLVMCHWPASPHWLDVADAVVLEVT